MEVCISIKSPCVKNIACISILTSSQFFYIAHPNIPSIEKCSWAKKTIFRCIPLVMFGSVFKKVTSKHSSTRLHLSIVQVSPLPAHKLDQSCSRCVKGKACWCQLGQSRTWFTLGEHSNNAYLSLNIFFHWKYLIQLSEEREVKVVPVNHIVASPNQQRMTPSPSHSIVNVAEDHGAFHRAEGHQNSSSRRMFQDIREVKTVGFDHDDDKYKRKSILEFLGNWWK